LGATEYAEVLLGRRPLPDRAVLLTFDDGFADLVDVVAPALAARGLRGTAFVTTGYLGRPGYLSRNALTQLATTDMEIGAHSVNHPHLDLEPPAVAHEEVVSSRTRLEDLLGRPVTSFAYPHGSHTRLTKSFVAGAGYVTAHAVKNAVSHLADDVLAVGRFTIGEATPDAQVAAVLAGDGAPRSWRGERWRTTAFRQVRRYRRARASEREDVR
jgi:peptidoglycan/xylan/chitin deacetylase (PgdA/CDA1 family)